MAGCKGEFSLSGSGGSKTPASPTAKKPAADDSSSSDGGGGGGGAVTPPPQVGKMEAGKAPPWCGGYEKSSSDSNKGWVKSYMEREGYDSQKTLEYIAKAACDKTDGERQAMVAEWAAGYKAAYGATDRDFVEAMTYAIKGQQDGGLQNEQCARYKEKDEEATPEQQILRKAEAWVLGCGNQPDDALLYWLDKPQITEVQRVALLHMCLGSKSSSDEDKSRGEFAFCLVDMKSLDRAKFDKEVAALNVNLYGKVSVTQNFGVAKARSEALLKKYAAKGNKDEEWIRLLEAPEKGWAQWMAAYDANKAAFTAVKEFEEKAGKGSKKALADCGGNLRKLWFDHMKKQKKVKDLETAQGTGTDMVGYPLLVAMMRCDAATGRYLEVAAAQDLFMTKAKESRGPRYAAYDATMAVLNEIRNDREKFPLERMYPQPPGMGRATWYKAYEQTFNKISYDRGTGQIKDVKKKGDVVNVTFKTVKWKEQEAYDCKDTRKVYRITDDGRLEYYQKCKYKTVARSSTLEPVVVPADFAAGLSDGLMVDIMIDRKKDGTRVGIPKGVYKDVDKKKFTGTFGVVW